ncbi:MAG: YjgP/YjgQ family permease [Cyanothece sp. SIO1E1]|nr:YjgP/YjgQ family permease [Cyanothece sp. SIO1E1]
MALYKFLLVGSFQPHLPILDRYIFTELLPPLLFSIGAFSSIGVAIGTVFDLVRRVTESGLPLTIAFQVLILKLPEFIAYALPTSILFATLMTYSRLSSDSELVAFRSCGVSIYRLVTPALLISLIVTGVTFWFNEMVVPAANYQATQTLRNALNQENSALLSNNIFYPEYREVIQPNGTKTRNLRRLFYADQFDGQRMQGLTVLDWSQQGLSQIVTSESAIWNSTQNVWDVFDGTIYLVAPDASYRNIVRFDKKQLSLTKSPFDAAVMGRDPYEMNIAQAREYLAVLRFSEDERKVLMLEVRIQQKMSFPFVCLVFGLVGATLGIRPQRTSKATSFGISVGIIFGYYFLSFIIGGLGLVSIITPFMAAWLPNFLGFGISGMLLTRAAR